MQNTAPIRDLNGHRHFRFGFKFEGNDISSRVWYNPDPLNARERLLSRPPMPPWSLTRRIQLAIHPEMIEVIQRGIKHCREICRMITGETLEVLIAHVQQILYGRFLPHIL